MEDFAVDELVKMAQEPKEVHVTVANDNISSLPNPANLLSNSKVAGKEAVE